MKVREAWWLWETWKSHELRRGRQILEAFLTTKKNLCIGIVPIGARKTCLQLSPIIGYNTVALQWLEQPCPPWGEMEEKLKGSRERKDSIPPHRKWLPRLITPEGHILSGRKALLCQGDPCRAPKATQCLPYSLLQIHLENFCGLSNVWEEIHWNTPSNYFWMKGLSMVLFPQSFLFLFPDTCILQLINLNIYTYICIWNIHVSSNSSIAPSYNKYNVNDT